MLHCGARPNAVTIMARGHLPSLGSGRDFDRHVRHVVQMLLPGGRPDVWIVAHAVHMSPRTLQRRLHGAGLTFVGVVQQARCAVARGMLRDPDRKISDIARALGYSDPAHFTRAFNRWTGITPRDFRRSRSDAAPRPSQRASRRPR